MCLTTVVVAEEHGYKKEDILAKVNHEKNTPLHAAINGGDIKVSLLATAQSWLAT